MIIPRYIIEDIFEQAAQAAPVEACGYLAGGDGRVVRHYPMTNVDASPEHFTMDPKEQFDAHRSARDRGMRIIGVYHSHPATPARPSDEDIRLAYDASVVYVIASLMHGGRTIRGFNIGNGSATEEDLIIEEGGNEQ